jgi:hypothetical protein
MFIVIHATAYGHYLYRYTETSSMSKLGWSWTLRREEAFRFKTREEAKEYADSCGEKLGKYIIKPE